MLGNVYCGQCGKKVSEVGRYRCECPEHGDVSGNRLRVVIKVDGQWLKKRFTNYIEAIQFLESIRVEIRKEKFDIRDYRNDEPLGFENLATEWLDLKKTQIKRHSWDSLNNFMRKAISAWGNRNVKEIGYAEIEDFLFKTLQESSSKSRANAKSVLNSFFTWLRRRRVLSSAQVPELPEVPFELEFRKTISKETQDEILAELRKISWEVNPRIYIAIHWLSTYFSIRPNELLNIKEGHIDRENGYIVIPHPKEKRPKIIPLIDDDIELVKSLPAAFPELHFFRHFQGHGGAVPGEQFGPRYLYRWWKRACANLDIQDIDMYAGTRHSSVIHLGQYFTPEQLRAASFHSTNKAFERYFRVKPDAIKAVYETGAKGGNKGVTKLPRSGKTK
jgi:integrase